MLNDKMALLPLKISDAYLLVWGVLFLGIGILLFGQYSYGWLSSIATVTLVTGILLPQLFRSLPSWRQKGIYIIALDFLLIGICVATLQAWRRLSPCQLSPIILRNSPCGGLWLILSLFR